MDGTMTAPRYESDEARWQALIARDPEAEGHFFYAVITTGVFCRPTCPSREPRRENVRFFGDAVAAEKAGWRPCRRCRPTGRSVAESQIEAIRRTCEAIDAAETPPSLASLAETAGMSPYHFHRLFKSIVGVTPRDYASAKRTGKLRDELAAGSKVTEAIFGAGYGSSSRLYEKVRETLGMTPSSFRAGAAGQKIRWSTADTPLGRLIVAATEAGICMIEFGADDAALAAQLAARFPRAETARADTELAAALNAVAGFIELPARGLDLPLDIQGTAFQQRVWRALQEIPLGATASYGEIAERIGEKGAARAVAGACGANKLALAIPCHRVIGGDGGISGYRWGVERKRELLSREKARPR
ncbi:MAG TPA: bifunctional DNA-binding transcriptional regulator/O6-methylguanine-DNA methyltransferase Ada [Aliidongia sp.]|nr:bifunctional DNA-binding transcriptional regulator/O6-methylguanine-DNA methyltransferase Ada [Aliidongia sp.]